MKLTSRKLWLFIVMQITFIAMCYDGKLDGNQFVNITEWLWASYVAGNVGEHYVNR